MPATSDSDNSDSDSASALNEIIRTLGKELKELKTLIHKSEARAQEAQTLHEDLEARYGDLVASGHELDTDYRGLQAKYDALVSDNSNLRAGVLAVIERDADFEVQTVALKFENTRLREELENARRPLKVEDEEPCILTAGNHFARMEKALEEATRRREEEGREHALLVAFLEARIEELDARCQELVKPKAKEAHQIVQTIDLPARHTSLPGPDTSPADDTSSESADDTSSESVDDTSSDSDDEDSASDSEGRQSSDVDLTDTGLDKTDASVFLQSEAADAHGALQVKYELRMPCGPNGQQWHALRETIANSSTLTVYWTCGHSEAIWSRGGTKCLLVFPTARYRKGDFVETTYEKSYTIGRERSLFFKVNNTWHYCGTFRCTHVMTASYASIKSLANGRREIMNVLTQRTYPKISTSQQQEFREKYMNGELSIRCVYLEKVGEDDTLCRAVDEFQVRQGSNTHKRPAQSVRGDSRKRRRYW